MNDDYADPLSDEAILALVHTHASLRPTLRMFFELDLRLARLVSATTEPMLGQMRLAWWREMLAKPTTQWPNGDQVLDGIKEHFGDQAEKLLTLVDAWEHMLIEPPFRDIQAVAFGRGRRDALLASINVDAGCKNYAAFAQAGYLWALADLASKVSLDEERTLLISLAGSQDHKTQRLPKAGRGIAVLGALGRRALSRGARPLMEGRGASLVAMRAAITGK